MESNITIKAVDQDLIVISREENGEPPLAYTMSQIRHWIMGSDLTQEQLKVIDALLERFELDLVDPV